MVQNLWWATGYNVLAIPVAAGALYPVGILLTPAIGAVLMSASTVIVAFNARFLRRAVPSPDPDHLRRVPQQEAPFVEIGIPRDDREPMLGSVSPDGVVVGS